MNTRVNLSELTETDLKILARGLVPYLTHALSNVEEPSPANYAPKPNVSIGKPVTGTRVAVTNKVRAMAENMQPHAHQSLVGQGWIDPRGKFAQAAADVGELLIELETVKHSSGEFGVRKKLEAAEERLLGEYHSMRSHIRGNRK